MADHDGNPRQSPRKVAKEMKHIGQTKSTGQQHTNQISIFDEFLLHIKHAASDVHSEWGSPMKSIEVSEEVIVKREVWGHFATFLCEEYRSAGPKNKGELVSVRTAHQLWSGVINQFKQKLGKEGNAQTKVHQRRAISMHTNACVPRASLTTGSLDYCAHMFLLPLHGSGILQGFGRRGWPGGLPSRTARWARALYTPRSVRSRA